MQSSGAPAYGDFDCEFDARGATVMEDCSKTDISNTPMLESMKSTEEPTPENLTLYLALRAAPLV